MRLRNKEIVWTREVVAEALQFLSAQQLVFLDRLTEMLNAYHGWHRSAAYYDLLCGEWLLHFTHIVYAAHLDVMRGTLTLPVQAPNLVFSDHWNFQRVVAENPLFSERLRWQVSRLLGGGDGESQFEKETCLIARPEAAARTRLKQYILSRVNSPLRAKGISFVISHPYVKCSREEWIKILWKWRNWARQEDFDYPVEVNVAVDIDWRRKYSADVTVSDFVDLVHKLLPLYMPVVYLEGLKIYREKAHALSLPRPKVIYTANSLHGETLFKTLAADWREEGTKILNHQHGGGYGLDRIHAVEEYETRVADCFYTLGWRSGDKQTPLIGAFSASQWYVRQENNRVLLNCISFPKQVYRIHFHPMPGTVETMIAETVDFVREICGLHDLYVRPYFNDYGWGMVDALRQVKPNLLLDDLRIPGPKSYARSALVVHNYLGTSLLETLALNIPTMCFYDVNIYAFRDVAQPYMASLEAVGVLHQSGVSAARFASGAMNDLQGWWQRPEVQEARQAFVQNYANFSSNWAQKWEIEFRQWI